ncbi:MAG: TetR/AcrR family transcriptional regulator [Pseudomonadota bacterium]
MKHQGPPSVALSRKGANTRASLLDAAFTLIAERGIHGVTVAQVCGATGLKRSSFYTHFKDLDDLISALSKRILDDFGRGSNIGDIEKHHSLLKSRIDFVFAETERTPALGNVIHELVFSDFKRFEAVLERVLGDVKHDVQRGVFSIEVDEAPAFAHMITATTVSLFKTSKSHWGTQLNGHETINLLLSAGGLKKTLDLRD